MAHVPESASIVKPYAETDAQAAERAWRGALTKCLRWVFMHTVPMSPFEHPVSRQIVRVDVDAISDTVDRIALAMKSQGRAHEALLLFDHVSSFVPLPGLSERMLSTKAVWLDAVLHDPDSASALLANVDPFATADAPLIEAYVAIVSPTETESLALLDRAIEYSRDEGSRLYNVGSKALALSLLGESERAVKLLSDAMNGAPTNDPLEVEGAERYTWARSWGIKFMIGRDAADGREAIKWFEAIDLSELNDSGKADILHQLGSLLSDAGDHVGAIGHLEHALELSVAQHTQIRLADVYMRAGRVEDARNLFSLMSLESTSPSLRAEYLTIQAGLAIHDRDQAGLRTTITSLQAIEIPQIYFREQRNAVCVGLLQILDQSARDWSNRAAEGRLFALLRRFAELCQYLELKPNVFGLGVNLNKILNRTSNDSEDE